MTKPILLIVDDDKSFVASLGRALSKDYKVQSAYSAAQALASLSPPPEIVLLDLRLDEEDHSNREGASLLPRIREQCPEVPILMITAHADVEIAIECIKLGAVDFLQKPRTNISEIKARLQRALQHSRLTRRVNQLEEELRLIEPRKIIGSSPAMQDIKRMIEVVARDANTTVLIRGETGTGKELIARAIHASGPRQAGPFVAVMLNALPLSMVEAELFGYEPGAFTDARKRHIGYLEKAHGGVLFLDEIGDVDANVQVKLLRFLEEREFRRLGSTSAVTVDVQVIAATNADLELRVREARFREDLYFRLNIHQIHLPPLRERAEDIPLLVSYLLELFRQQGKRVYSIAAEVLDALREFSWPGNVRQLKNSIESAILWAGMREHDRIEIADLPSDIRVEGKQSAIKIKGIGQPGFSIHEALAQAELSYIEQALEVTHGKKSEAWRLLGYNDRFALYRRARRILGQYPNLSAEFPRLKKYFDK